MRKIKINNKDVGSRIKMIRLNMGLPAVEFGERIAKGLGKSIEDNAPSQSLISRWERGVNLPNKERLKVIAQLGGISVNELLYGDLKQYVYNVLHDELLESGELYEKISEYILLLDNDIDNISSENDKTDLLQIKSESFFKDNFDSIFDYIRQGFPLMDANDLYDSVDLIITRAMSYIDMLIYNKRNNIIVSDYFKLTFLKKVSLDNVEQYKNESKYIFSCRISLETTDDLGNREYLELDYIANALVNIYISEVDNNHGFVFGGLYAFNDDLYRYILSEQLFKDVKQHIVDEILKHDRIKNYSLTFEDFEDLT